MRPKESIQRSSANERKSRSQSFCDNRGGNARPGARITEKTQLSKEEHDRRVTEKLCFKCGEPGHQSRACPHTRTIKGSDNSKPLGGVTAYSIDIGTLQALADATERINTLTLGSAQIELESGKIDDLPTLEECDSSEDEEDFFQIPETENLVATKIEPSDLNNSDEDDLPGCHLGLMGDPLARRAVHVLKQGCPYPGDVQKGAEEISIGRFHVYRTSVTHHIIIDSQHLDDPESDARVESHLLLNSEFNLGEWYAKDLIRRGYGTEQQHRQHSRFAPMGNAIAFWVQDLLLEMLDPNWQESNRLHHFECMTQSEGIIIWDRAVNLRTYLPFQLALKERFNVINWYSTVTQKAWNNIKLVWKDPDLPWAIPKWLFAVGQTDPEKENEVDEAPSDRASIHSLDLFGAQVPRGSYVAIERNATTVKDFK